MASAAQVLLSTQKESGSVLTAVSVEGFKSFRSRREVSFAPLTVLAGQNSAGKSSLLQPMLLMKQTIESVFESVPLLLNGACVRVQDSATLFWRGSGEKKNRSWRYRIAFGDRWVEMSYGHEVGVGLRLMETKVGRPSQDPVTLREDLSPERLAGVAAALGFPDRRIPGNLRSKVVASRVSHAVRLAPEGDTARGGILMQLLTFDDSWLSSMIYLPGLRGNPERSYPRSQVADNFYGPFSPYTASVLLQWKEQKDESLSKVGRDLQRLGLTWKVDPRRMDDTQVEVSVGRLPAPRRGGAQDLVNIADVGFGLSQVLPVVVALHAARPGQLVYIEQPELHLHPNAQVQLAVLLQEAISRGVRVVIETHSSVLLKAIQVAVAEGTLRPEEVILHWFTRGADGATELLTSGLDGTGAYGDWPVDFADVEMDIERRFINAAFRSGE